MERTLQQMVDEALDEAVYASGYVGLADGSMSPREVAEDMQQFCPGFGDEDANDLVDCVASYQQWFSEHGHE